MAVGRAIATASEHKGLCLVIASVSSFALAIVFFVLVAVELAPLGPPILYPLIGLAVAGAAAVVAVREALRRSAVKTGVQSRSGERESDVLLPPILDALPSIVAPIVRNDGANTLVFGSDEIALKRRPDEERQGEKLVVPALALLVGKLVASRDEMHLLEKLCEVVTEVFECDASHTFLVEEDGAYRVVAGHGDDPAQWRSLRAMRVPESLVRPIVGRLESEGVFQISVAEAEQLPSAALSEKFGITRVLYFALRQGGDIVGVQTVAFLGRQEALPSWQEDLARGIADIASQALETIRLAEERP